MSKIDANALTKALEVDDYKQQWEQHLGQYGDVHFIVEPKRRFLEIRNLATGDVLLKTELTDDEWMSFYSASSMKTNWGAIKNCIEYHLGQQSPTA